MTPAPSPIRRFTGWHMTAILIAFFAAVIAVNMLMATVAVRSFGGTVVENSYVASQKFNGWLAQARAQRRLGWRRSEEHTSELQSLMRISYAVFCLKKKNRKHYK